MLSGLAEATQTRTVLAAGSPRGGAALAVGANKRHTAEFEDDACASTFQFEPSHVHRLGHLIHNTHSQVYSQGTNAHEH